MTVTVDLINEADAETVPAPSLLQTWVEAALQALPDAPMPARPVCLSVRIVDSTESARLNQTYRQKDAATNVLSFSSQLPAAIIMALDEVPLGDLVICASVVNREAQEQHKSLSAHWAHMLVHGTLHLSGFDHINDSDAETMESLEIGILSRLGFDNPYQPH